MKEIIIVETNKQGIEAAKFHQRIKDFLNEFEAVYQIYEVNEKENKEEIYHRDMRLASQETLEVAQQANLIVQPYWSQPSLFRTSS